jgi:hypothetical protein
LLHFVITLRGALRAYRLDEQLQASMRRTCTAPPADILVCAPSFAVVRIIPRRHFQALGSDSAFGEHFLGTDSWLPFA